MVDVCASVLVATHNCPQLLRRTLLGFTRQTRADFEIVVCDDGSGPEVEGLLGSFAPEFDGRLKHVWQEHRGFRKCRILNEGILNAAADYVIFIDADCIPHRRFVEEHLYERRPATVLAGRRVELGPRVTARLTDDAVLAGRLERAGFWSACVLRRELRHSEAGIYVPRWLRFGPIMREVPLLGCNFSCNKADIIAVNGFDEQFVGAGYGEDTDIERRLRLLGLRSRSVRHAAICYHQYHSPLPRPTVNMELSRQLAEEKTIRCERGLDEHRSLRSRP